jgi:hypothetical protein
VAGREPVLEPADAANIAQMVKLIMRDTQQQRALAVRSA